MKPYPPDAAATIETEFDAAYYRAVNPELAEAGADPLAHYVATGWREGRDPSPLFSTRHYLQANPDVAAQGIEPFWHYLAVGRYEGRGRIPPLFDPAFYAAVYPGIRAPTAAAHYAGSGAAEGHSPSPLFDVAFYRAQLPPGPERRADPLEHYLEGGWRRGLSPHPLFDPAFYVAQLADDARTIPPLAHYVAIGWRQGLAPHLLFDPEHYARLAGLGAVCPLLHYLTTDLPGAEPHYLFSDGFYLAAAAAAFAAQPALLPRPGQRPLVHYVTHGAAAAVATHPLFDPRRYRREVGRGATRLGRPELLASYDAAADKLRHYLEVGWRAGIGPTSIFDLAFYGSELGREIAGDPVRHYLEGGFRLASPNPAFDNDFYCAAARIDPARAPPLLHLLRDEPGRRVPAHPAFDQAFYVAANADLASAGVCPVVHFIEHGLREGRAPNGLFSADYVYRLFPERSFQEANVVETYLAEKLHQRSRILMVVPDDPRVRPAALAVARELSATGSVECLAVPGGEKPLPAALGAWAHVPRTAPPTKDGEPAGLDRSAVWTILRDNLPALALAFCPLGEPWASEVAARGIPTLTLVQQAPTTAAEAKAGVARAGVVIFASDFALEAARKLTDVPPGRALVRHPLLPGRPLPAGSRAAIRQQRLAELGLPDGTVLVVGTDGGVRPSGRTLFEAAAVKALAEEPPGTPVACLWLAGDEETGGADVFASRDADRFADRLFTAGPGDAEDWIAAADLVVVAGCADAPAGLAATILAAGVPSIVFAEAGTVAEIIGDSCQTVPAARDDLAAAIGKLAADPAARKGLAARARQRLTGSGGERAYTRDILAASRLGDGRPGRLPSLPAAPRGARKQIFFSATDWQLSGVNTFTEHLVQDLNARDFDAKILFTRGRYSELPPAGQLPDVPRLFLQPPSDRPEDVWASLLAFLGDRPDGTVYVPNYDFVGSAVAPLVPPHVALVGIVHSDDPHHYEHARRLGPYWDVVVSVSQHIQKEVLRQNSSYADKSVVIRYGVPFDEAEAEAAVAARRGRRPDQPIRLLYAGRLVSRQKRVRDYARLARKLDAAGIPFQLTMLGDGTERASLERDLARFIADGRAVLPGRATLAAVREAMARADAFVLLSDFEGLSLALLEAMAVGCVPLVRATDSGVAEVLSDGTDGFILPRGDLGGFVEVLGQLQRDPARAADHSAAVVRAFRHHRLERAATAEAYAALFELAAADAARRSSPRYADTRGLAGRTGILPPPWLRAAPA